MPKHIYFCISLDVFKGRKICEKGGELVSFFLPLFDHLRFLCLEDRYLL
jgi:hypothetical protein